MDQTNLTDVVIYPEEESSLNQEVLEESDYGSVKITRKDGIRYNVVTTTALEYDALRNDSVIFCEHTADCSVILPDNPTIGKEITIKNNTGSYSVDIYGGVDGSGLYTITDKQSVTVTYNGLVWLITASHLI